MRRTGADSRLALIWRRLSRRFGLAAPQVAVRTHVAWYWRLIGLVLALSVAFALGGWAYDTARNLSWLGPPPQAVDVDALRARLAELERQLALYRNDGDAVSTAVEIERTAQQQLLQQVKALEDENARLKQDLAMFQSLASSEPGRGELEISGLRVEAGASARLFRYRMLVSLRGGGKTRERDFKGNYLIAVKVLQDNRNAIITFPAAAELRKPEYQLAFKHFQRIDGEFQVPDGAQVQSVEVRLVQDGVVKAAKTAKVS